MKFSFFLSLSLSFGLLFGQGKYVHEIHIPNQFAKSVMDSAYSLSMSIDSFELKRVLQYLSSDSCMGRELGTLGNDIASDYIASEYEKNKIPKVPSLNSYFQDVNFSWHSWKSTSFTVDGFDYRQIWDYISIPESSSDIKINTDSLIFLGYGIEHPGYNDYSGVDVRGKTILIYNGEPRNKRGNYYISGTEEVSEWSKIDRKVKSALKHGVHCIIIIEENFKKLGEQYRSSLYSPVVVLQRDEIDFSKSVNQIHLSSTMVSKMLGKKQKKLIAAREKINKTGKPKSILFPLKLEVNLIKEKSQVRGRNILAYFEGTDKKDELVILTAHYDHIGMRGQDVFNGADDNGSGSSALVQISKTLKAAIDSGYRLRRSILVMHVTGEEKGLLGSMYYVNSPIFPLDKTMVNINVDMIGRSDSKYQNTKKYSYVIGSDRLSKDLHQFNESINSRYSHLLLDYTYNAEDDPNRFYYRSDHYNFAEKGIPSIFFFSGIHEDYHRITDDEFKIKYEKYTYIVRHLFLLTWGLANREASLTLNPKE
ncbi:MAG: M28 family peptidase [Saprospiraceae bacterium]|nr:M28 family peptidase [Saprospiraceae bacterium]